MTANPLVHPGDRIRVLARVKGRRVGMVVRVTRFADGVAYFTDKGNSAGGRATAWEVVEHAPARWTM